MKFSLAQRIEAQLSQTDIYSLFIYLLGLHTFVCSEYRHLPIKCSKFALYIEFVCFFCRTTVSHVLFIHSNTLIAFSPLLLSMSAVHVYVRKCLYCRIVDRVAAIRCFQRTQFDSIGNVRLGYVYCVQNYLLNAVIRRLEWCAFIVVTHFQFVVEFIAVLFSICCITVEDSNVVAAMDKVSKIPIYLYKECVTDLVQAVEYSEQINCNVLVTSITNPKFRREFHHQPLCRSHIRFTRSELMLEPSKWVSQVVTKLSNTVDCDSPNEHVRKSSEQTLKQEISFAQHVAHQMLIKINGTNTSNLARTICAELSGNKGFRIIL